MPDFSYLDASGIGQIETPTQQPNTLQVEAPHIGYGPAKPTLDFGNIWKEGAPDTGTTPLFNDTLDMSKFKGKTPPRSFDADRLIPYKQSGAYKDLGYNPGMPEDKIQAQYDYDQSNWEAMKSSVSDFFHITGQSFTNYFKTYGDSIKWLTNRNQEGIMYNDLIPQVEADNEAQRSNLRFKGDVPTHWYNYIPFPGLLKGDVAEELLPQLGFTVGTGAAAIIENLGVSLMTAGTGEAAEIPNTATKMYKLISEFNTLARGTQLVKSGVSGTVEGLRAGLDMWRLTNATLSETSLEAATNLVQHKQKLIQDYIDKNGHAPLEGSDDMKKIENSAHDVARETMWGEFPVLFASNWIQYRNLLAPNLAKKLAENEVMKGMKIVNTAENGITSQFAVSEAAKATLGQRVAGGASHFLKNAVTEGLEESGQRLVSTAASDYEEKLYQGKEHSMANSIFQVGVPDILSDSGLQEFMGGFVTGGLFHAFGMAGNKLATLKGVFNEDGTLSGKGNLLTRMGFGTEEIARAKVKGQLQSVANLLNTEDLKDIFKEEGLANFIKATQTSQAMNAALFENDLFNVGNLKSNALVRFLYTGMETGKLDLRLAQLDAFRGLSQEELNKFLDIDTGALDKNTTGAVIDHIIEKAGQVEEIFDEEKDRFKDKEISAIKAFNTQNTSHEGLEQTLRTKYGIDPNEKDIRGPLIQKLAEDPENEELKTDLASAYDSNINRNLSYMNLVAVREGRKAAVFAAAQMQIDSDRSKEAIGTMQDYDLAYSDLNNTLNLTELQQQQKELQEQAKVFQGVDSQKMLEIDDKLRRLDRILHHLSLFYRENIDGSPYGHGMPISEADHYDEGAKALVAAGALYDYLHDELDPQKLRTKGKETRMLAMILRLEKRNRDNLSLYNRLTTSDQGFDEYSKQETQKTAATIGRWTNEYLKQHADEPESEPIQQPTEQEEQVVEHVEPVQPVQTQQQQDFDAIKSKVAKGEPLSDEEKQFLAQGALVNPDIAEFRAAYLAKQPKPTQPAAAATPTAPTTQTVYTSPKTEQAGYRPDVDKGQKPDEVAEKSRLQEHNGQVIGNPNRTIVNEVPKAEFDKIQPKLEGGYTEWKQGFFNHIAQNDLVDRFQGRLAIDEAANYPKGTVQRDFLEKNPDKAGLVLMITDKAGNTNFTREYVPRKNGSMRIVHSMPNSPGKAALLTKMKAMGITHIDGIQFSNLSQGIFDELENPRHTAELLEGISAQDYQFIIAQGASGEDIYYDNGMAMKNGGLYIKTAGSYIKLLPEYAGNLVIGTDSNPDVYGLLGRNYATYEDAKTIAEFLQKLFYTNKEKGGLQFSIDKNGDQYQVNASIMQVGAPLQLTPVELAGTLKGQRINIDMNSLGTTLKFYHVEQGKVVSTDVDYNEFLRNNTLTNKKAYENSDGRKVIKPVNRYLTLAADLQQMADTLEPQVALTLPQETQNIVSRITDNQKKVQGKTDDGQFYIIDGEQYKRVTNVIPNDFDGDTTLYENSRIAGSTVDGIVRAFFTTGDITKPENISQAAFDHIIDALADIKKTIESRGEMFLTNNLVMFDTQLKIAGEVDILSVDSKGQFRIYDIKTAKDFGKYDSSYKGKLTKRQQHTNQLSAYHNLFTSQYGVSPISMGILPFQISYDKAGNIQTAEKLKGIPIIYDPNINTLVPITGQRIQSTEEQKPDTLAQPSTRRNRKKIDPNDESGFKDTERLFKQKSGVQEPTVPMQEEAQWINQRFGSDVAQLSDIVDAGAWATWTQGGITLLKEAPQGTGYHEAWHHFSQLYLTPEQRKSLYDEVRDKANLAKASDRELEEHVAEDFRQYVLSGGQNILGTSPRRNTLFRRIFDFLKKFFQDITGRRDLDRLYRDLYRGNLKSYRPDIANAQFGKLNSKITDAEGNELLNNQKSYRFMNHMEAVAGQVLANANVSVSQFMTGDKELSRQRALELGREMRKQLINQFNDLDEELAEFEDKYPGQSSPLFETWQDLEKIIENFPSVFRQFYAQSAYNSGILSTADQDALDIDIEEAEKTEASFGGKQWDVTGNEESVLDSATAETKALIWSLSRVLVDKDGTPVRQDGKVQLFRNEFGLNEPVNFIRTINNIGNLLEGSFSYEEMLDKLKDSGNQKRFPELALLVERLPDYTQPLKYPDVKMLSSFLKSFSKTYVPVYTLVRLRDGNFLFREETRRSQDIIEREWANKFSTTSKDSPLVKSGVIQFDANDRPFIAQTAVLDYDLSSVGGRKNFLALLGVDINARAEGTKDYNDAVNPAKLGYVLQSIRTRLKAGQKISNPISDLRKEYRTPNGGAIKSEKSTINDIIKLESKYTDTNPSMAFRNAEGKVQHGLSENNWITNNNYWLSRTDNYSQITSNPNTQHLNIGNNPYIAHSLFLNKLFNLDPTSQSYGQRRRINGSPVVLTLGNYNGYEQEQEEGKNNKGASTAKLSPKDKLIMDVNSLLLAGAVEIMRTESSSSAFFVKLSDYADQEGRVKDLPFTAQEIDADPRNPAVINYFLGAFQDEIATIANKFNSNLPDYKKNIGRFTMFDGILSKDTKDAILKDISSDKKLSPEKKQDGLDNVYRIYQAQVAREIGNFLENEVKDFENLLKEQGVTKDDISKTLTQPTGQNLGMPSITTAFVINDFILNSEFAKLFDGNVGFFKAYHKRAKGNTSTGTRAFTDGFLKSYLDQSKQNTLAGALGDTSDVNLNETRTLVFRDDTRASVYTSGRDALYRKALRALGQEDDATNKLLDKAYGNMNVADGQGQATLDFYREMRMRVSNWSYADEVQFQKEVIWFRQEYNLYKDDTQRARDEQFLETFKDTSSTFPPMKMQYNGALKEKGVFAPILDKFSVAPLIPRVIKGTVWESVNQQLLKEGIGYTKFESGTKKYKWTPTEFYAATDKYTTSLAEQPEKYNAATHLSEGLKEQLKTSSEPKDEATWGTQMRKLFLANLFNSGIAPDKFKQVLNNYVDLLNKVEDQQRKNLYKEFGITEDNNNLVIRDVKNFVKTLQRQVNSRALNDNIKNFIQYDQASKSFVYPLEVSLNKVQVQDLISGMIFNRLTRLKVNGDMLIQVASSGFENTGFQYTNATEEDNLKYGSNGLPFYTPTFNADGTLGTTKAMRVKVALIKEWAKLLNATHMDGEKMGTIERLNEALRDDKWRDENRRKITMVGYRIPTQGPNSMEFMEVHEFLPPVAGSIVILPAEIVAKAGSDYDIDKLPIIRPSFTDEGELADEAPEIYEKRMEEIRKKLEGLFTKEKEVNSTRTSHDYNDVNRFMDKVLYGYDAEELEQEIDSLILDNDDIQELLGKYQRLASNRYGSITNKVIDLYKDVLSSPEMFKQLITPNNVDMIKPVAQEIAKATHMAGFDSKGDTQEFSNTDVLKYRSNLVKFQQLLSGKRDVGIFAKANTNSQLLQQSGMVLNKKYVLKDNTGDYNRELTLTLFSPAERETLGASKANKEGEITDMIDYSSNVDINGIYKQEYFSQMINGTVDVAGDPWYMGLLLNDYVKSAYVHMINLGVPARRALFFLAHPAVQRLTKVLASSDPTEKWRIIGSALGMGNKAKKGAVLQAIESIDTGKNYQTGFYFREEELLQHIKNPKSAKDWYDRQVIAHFLKLDEQGRMLRDLQTITSFDTTKYISPISIQANLDLREKVRASSLFDWDGVQKIMQHSMISAFNNLDKSIEIFERLMPIGMHRAIIRESADIMRNFRGDNLGQWVRLERTLNNDWIEFIIKNFGEIEGFNWEDYARELLIFNGGNEVLATKLVEMKNRMPQLNYYESFRRLYNDSSERSAGWRNIKLERGLDNSSDYQNVLIEEMTQLSNFQGNEIAGATFTPEQVLEVRDFFRNLSYLAFMQSGFNKSRLYFTDIIPTDNLVPGFRQALSAFNEFTKQHPETLRQIIKDFRYKFKEQNPNFVIDNDEMPPREAWRGKLYRIFGDDSGQQQPTGETDPGGPVQEQGVNPEPDGYVPSIDSLMGNIPSGDSTKDQLIAQALQHAGDIKGIYKMSFNKDPERFLFEIAQQANSSEAEMRGAYEAVGGEVFDAATKLFPNAKPGDTFDKASDDQVDRGLKDCNI